MTEALRNGLIKLCAHGLIVTFEASQIGELFGREGRAVLAGAEVPVAGTAGAVVGEHQPVTALGRKAARSARSGLRIADLHERRLARVALDHLEHLHTG